MTQFPFLWARNFKCSRNHFTVDPILYRIIIGQFFLFLIDMIDLTLFNKQWSILEFVIFIFYTTSNVCHQSIPLKMSMIQSRFICNDRAFLPVSSWKKTLFRTKMSFWSFIGPILCIGVEWKITSSFNEKSSKLFKFRNQANFYFAWKPQ